MGGSNPRCLELNAMRWGRMLDALRTESHGWDPPAMPRIQRREVGADARCTEDGGSWTGPVLFLDLHDGTRWRGHSGASGHPQLKHIAQYLRDRHIQR